MQHGMAFPVLLDEAAGMRAGRPRRGIAASLVDRRGVVRHIVIGAVSVRQLERLIEPWLTVWSRLE